VEQVLLTGASGSVGQMLAADANAFAHVRQAIRIRDEVQPSPDPDCTLLLHLANIATNVEENLRLQQKLARAIQGTKINQVILPLSFSTLGALGTEEPSPAAFNFGFQLTLNDPYPKGKLKAEEFWLNWQSESPGRKLLLLYIPTILGPHSAWTTSIARFAPEQILVVPKLDHCFAIRESELVELFQTLFVRGLEMGVERRLAYTTCASLRELIASDRNGPVQEAPWPAFVRGLCGLATKHRLANSFVAAPQNLLKRVMRIASKKNIFPLSPNYVGLFLRQSEIADRFQRALLATSNVPDRECPHVAS
jgi:hypothetical protein